MKNNGRKSCLQIGYFEWAIIVIVIALIASIVFTCQEDLEFNNSFLVIASILFAVLVIILLHEHYSKTNSKK